MGEGTTFVLSNSGHLQSLITQRCGQPPRIAAADADRAAGTGGQLRQRGRELEPPATDDEHPVGRLRDLGEHMTGDEHRAAL